MAFLLMFLIFTTAAVAVLALLHLERRETDRRRREQLRAIEARLRARETETLLRFGRIIHMLDGRVH